MIETEVMANEHTDGVGNEEYYMGRVGDCGLVTDLLPSLQKVPRQNPVGSLRWHSPLRGNLEWEEVPATWGASPG